MQLDLFMYCTVGRRAELGSGMTGKDPWLCRGMLDETAESNRHHGQHGRRAHWTRRAGHRAPGHLTCSHTEG